MIEPERLAYDLTADSLVWDVGAYRGEFTEAIVSRFGCWVDAFEPIREFALEFPIAVGFEVHGFGLFDRDEEVEISLAGDRTSAHVEAANDPLYHSNGKTRIRLRDVVGFMDEHNIPQVDLAKINIEGGEYPLLRRLIDSGYVTRFRHLQVQFHTFIPEFGEKYLAIKKDLQRTHDLSWRWPWKWESWARR